MGGPAKSADVGGARKEGDPNAKIAQGYNLYLGWGSGLEGCRQESGYFSYTARIFMGIDPKPNTITRATKTLVDSVCVGLFGWFRHLVATVM